MGRHQRPDRDCLTRVVRVLFAVPEEIWKVAKKEAGGAATQTPDADRPSMDKPRDQQADIKAAAYAIRCMYGSGEATALTLVAKLKPEVVAQMADNEREGRRDRIPAILHKVRSEP